MKKQISVAFATAKLKADFEALKDGKSEEQGLHKELCMTLDALRSDPGSGIRVPKRIWPKFYKKRHLITNLWKRDLRSGWRVTYTIKFYEEKTICMILEWMTHKEYERRFGYHAK
ncbi:MAG: hypothetical protein KKD17_01535 [Nanoarchaeota archaeon]|nr:hypothetical protein [Nanoarchaeota archaeon]